jgi:hypothetical protein
MLTPESGHKWGEWMPMAGIGWLGRARLRRRSVPYGDPGATHDAEATQPLHRRVARARGTGLLWKVIAHGTEPGNPHGLLLAWPRWEHFAHSMWPTRQIPGTHHDILRVRFVPYRGESLALPDATEIRPGMIVGELHCNNQAILDLVGRGRGNPYRAAREDLRCLARWIARPGFDLNVQAFFGVTLIAKAAARLGFSVRARPPTLRRRLERMFMTGLLVLYTLDGLSRIERGTTVRSYPQEVWLSRRELLHRYGKHRYRERARPELLAHLN